MFLLVFNYFFSLAREDRRRRHWNLIEGLTTLVDSFDFLPQPHCLFHLVDYLVDSLLAEPNQIAFRRTIEGRHDHLALAHQIQQFCVIVPYLPHPFAITHFVHPPQPGRDMHLMKRRNPQRQSRRTNLLPQPPILLIHPAPLFLLASTCAHKHECLVK